LSIKINIKGVLKMPNNYDIMQKIHGLIIDKHIGISREMANKLTKRALELLDWNIEDEKKNKEVIRKVILESDLKPIEKKYYLFMKENMSEEKANEIVSNI
jgi:hypothetical protein